jgi:hypothetical protein
MAKAKATKIISAHNVSTENAKMAGGSTTKVDESSHSHIHFIQCWKSNPGPQHATQVLLLGPMSYISTFYFGWLKFKQNKRREKSYSLDSLHVSSRRLKYLLPELFSTSVFSN